MKLTLKGKTRISRPVKVDFNSATINLTIKQLNQQLKKFGYGIIKLNKE